MSTLPMNLQSSFASVVAWQTLMQLLTDQMPGVDIQAISNSDFNADGELIMTPPSVRVYYDGDAASALGDAQKLAYNTVGRYMVTCADQDLKSTVDQAMASAALADYVKGLLCGARLGYPDGEVSEPVTWISTVPVPVTGLGIAYAVGFEVPGIAQFPGTNAHGFTMSAAEQGAQAIQEAGE
jgi:hypothetical protein